MSAYLALLQREWREWRMVIAIVLVLYVIGLIGAAVALRKGGDLLSSGRDNEAWQEQLEELDEEEIDIDSRWFDAGDIMAASQAQILLFGWAHMLRTGVSFINLILLVVGLYYLSDAVYKERSDGSTFFHRGMPVGDVALLSSKLLMGTVGILVLSYLLGVFWVLEGHLTFPSGSAQMMAEFGFSPSQVAVGDLILDWAVFHILQLAWLLPVAAYFLLVSTVTRSRPVLVGVGVPLLLGLLWRFLVGDNALLRELTANFSVLGDILVDQWQGGHPQNLAAGEPVVLFGSFSEYVLSLRTLFSVLVAGGLFGLTFFAYRKNLPVS